MNCLLIECEHAFDLTQQNVTVVKFTNHDLVIPSHPPTNSAIRTTNNTNARHDGLDVRFKIVEARRVAAVATVLDPDGGPHGRAKKQELVIQSMERVSKTA
jgi:hypothetical protein